MGTGYLSPGAKQEGCDFDHLPTASGEVHERVELSLYFFLNLHRMF
jgi:hypothetical protein